MVGNKTDFNEASAIFDAVTRPNKRVVRIKTIEQQDIQLVHTLRSQLDDNVKKYDKHIQQLSKENERSRRYLKSPWSRANDGYRCCL